MSFLRTFLASVLVYSGLVGVCVWLITKPIFLPILAAAGLFLCLVMVHSALRAASLGNQNLVAYRAGLIVVVALVLAMLTLLDWSIGTAPEKDLTIAGFTRYLSHIDAAPSVVASFLLPPLLATLASVGGHWLGSHWRRTTDRP